MSNFKIVPLNTAYTDRLRQSTHDDFGHPLENRVASATGYGPCRCCLQQTQPGENLLLFSYAPVNSDNAYNDMDTIPFQYERVAQAIEYLHLNFRQQPDLAAVARQVHLSPEHFQRMFTAWAGVSPKKFMQFLTLDHLRGKICEMPSLQAAADDAGLSAQSRVYDLFINIEGVTPGAWREGGVGLSIRYGYHNTPFGLCFIAVADRGVCGLSFVDEDRQRNEFELFQQKWFFAELVHAPDFTQNYVQQIFYPTPASWAINAGRTLNIVAQGTNFQLKVWEALLRIPPGSVTTYGHIAKSIGKPAAARAVGTAIGSNPVGFLIPCHRVIQSTGRVGDYHWGASRKGAILGREMAAVIAP